MKTQIRDLTAAISAVVGGTVGDSAFNSQLAGVVGQNAVENNGLNFNVVNVDESWAKAAGSYSAYLVNSGASVEEQQKALVMVNQFIKKEINIFLLM